MTRLQKHIASAVSFVYFFLNIIGLPAPLSWTGLMSVAMAKPVLTNHFRWLAMAGSILAVFSGIHLMLGVDLKEFIPSAAYFVFLIYTAFAAFEFLKTRATLFPEIFRSLSLGAAALVVIGLLTLNTSFERFFWHSHDFIGEGERVLRFYGLAYEPSHLALVLSPLFLYFLIKSVEKPQWPTILRLMAVAVPIALTVSFGFAAALGPAICTMILVLLLTSAGFRKRLLIPVAVAMLAAGAVCSFSNPLSDRVFHILQGKDTSVNGRTTEAFMLAYKCAEVKSIWFGIGPGQVKIVGEEVIRPYYAQMDPVGYSKENWPVMSLPNSMAETLAMFGIVGVLLKLAVQIFLFIRFRVHRNYFNLSVFSFMFFYQLMGSFMLSTTEMMMWVLAVAPLFPALNVQKVKQK